MTKSGHVAERDHVVGDTFQLLRAVAAGHGDDRTLARFDLLDVVEVLREDGVVRRDEDAKEDPGGPAR